MDKRRSCRRIEDLDLENVVAILEHGKMWEFVEFVREKQLDGRKLLEVTEGIVKLWRPKANAKNFIQFIHELKSNPQKYLESLTERNDVANVSNATNSTDCTNVSIESQYQTVSVKKIKEEHFTTTTVSGVEEILKKIVPAKSFLYRNQPKKTEKTATSYLPMDAGTPKKPRRFFRLSSYEYPHVDLRLRFSKQENFNDRGYYSVKTNSRFYIQKTYRKPESKPKYKSISTTEELNDKFPEDHFYEDLCYNDMDKEEEIKVKEPSTTHVANVKPCIAKIQELFHSFKLPFFRRNEEVEEDIERKQIEENVKEANFYENNECIANMYDSVHVMKSENGDDGKEKEQAKLAVEDYLEPIQASKDYCDVQCNKKDESLLAYIMSIFENRLGIRRETTEAAQSEDSDTESHRDATETRVEQKWCETRKPRKTNMADRPLPVPVENEPYYMNVDRSEAENMLKGQPDGTFILRPSSQPNHAYTLTVSCANAVHNVGVRRRPDGRLALGFARRGERSFTSVTSLLRHHRKRRLLLVVSGGLIGATTLNEPPHYYQSPSNIPVPV